MQKLLKIPVRVNENLPVRPAKKTSPNLATLENQAP